MKLQRLRPHEWRIHVYSRVALALFVGLLAGLGVLDITEGLYLLALMVALMVYLLVVGLTYTWAGAWLDWFSLGFDAVGLASILQLSGRTVSPLIVIVYLWLFSRLTMNVRHGDAAAVYPLSTVGLLVLGTGTWGDPRWVPFMSFQLLALLNFAAISGALLRERRHNQKDPLTQVLHRGAGLERLAERIERGEPFDLAFIDLKEFKRVNDRLGHLAGDEVLSGLAGRLLARVRGQDPVIRYGGDEFLVVGPKNVLADRLANVFARPIATSQGSVRVKGDIGIVTWEPHRGEGLADLLKRADAAMYRMKYTKSRENPHQAGGDRPQGA